MQGKIVSIEVAAGDARSQGHAGRRAGSDEDGASRRRGCFRPRAFRRGEAGRCSVSKASRCSSSCRKMWRRTRKRLRRESRSRLHPARSCGVAMRAMRFGLDANRPDAVARRRKTNQRTARENVADLVDPGSFIEYGALAFAAQKRRRTLEDLIKNTPGDGIITGIGTVNAAQFGEERGALRGDGLRLHRACGHAGRDEPSQEGSPAQGRRGMEAADRAVSREGGGGRPGDTDFPGVAGLDTPTFRAIREAQRAGAARRHQFRALFRGQCRTARLQRCRSSRPRIPISAWAGLR